MSAATEAEVKGQGRQWFYLTGTGDAAQTHGPFDVDAMKGLFTGQYVTEDAMVWAEGQPEWLPLKACHELYSALVFQDAAKKEPEKDAQLAAFEAEIAAVEAGTELDTGSPPPDERAFVDDDGTQFVWDVQLRKFVPSDLSVSEVKAAQAGAGNGATAAPAPGGAAGAPARATQALPEYTPEMMRFQGNEEKVVTVEEARAEEAASEALAEQLAEARAQGTKRSAPDADAGASGMEQQPGTSHADPAGGAPNTDVGASGGNGAEWFELKNNTSVYVTGLPDDATPEEVASEFSKCGVIKTLDDGSPKIKLYRDKETGMMKGDGTVTFLLRPSVRIATTIMTGRPLRPGSAPDMTVQEAQFEMKGDFVAKKRQKGGTGGGGSGGGKAGKGAKGKAKPAVSQKDKVLSWSGFDDTHKASEVTVLVAGLFSLEEMVLSPDLHEQLCAYLLSRCRDLGAVDKVRVLKRSVAGVATVKMRTPEAAEAARARLAATVAVTGMFTQASLAADETLPRVVLEDTLLKCRSLGVVLAAEVAASGAPQCAAQVLLGSSSGRVMVACANEAEADKCVAGVQGAGYAGVALQAARLTAIMWDGVTNPNTWGQESAAADDEARLDAYAAELAAE